MMDVALLQETAADRLDPWRGRSAGVGIEDAQLFLLMKDVHNAVFVAWCDDCFKEVLMISSAVA